MQPNWEMEIDTPATIAIIGGGPIALEAALYARFLGYFVQLYDSAKLAQGFLRWHDAPLHEPFGAMSTSLAKAAIEAQGEAPPLPADDAFLTAKEYVQRYLVPLGKTDLLYENIHVHSRVVGVSRLQYRRDDRSDIQDRADDEFRLLVHSKKRGWFTERADIILDASGCGDIRYVGPGGAPAVGELEEEGQIVRGVLPLEDAAMDALAGRRVVLFGLSIEACINAIELAKLVKAKPDTRVTWIVPLDLGEKSLERRMADRALRSKAWAHWKQHALLQEVLSGSVAGFGVMQAAGIDRMQRSAAGLTLTIQVNEQSTVDVECDEFVGCAGTSPNWDHASALSIGVSPWHQKAVQAAARDVELMSNAPFNAGQSILTQEPHYHVLGSKSLGLSHDCFDLMHGYDQIRAAFGYIGGRVDLDLYKQFQKRA